MFFHKITLKNFGPFESAEFTFRPGTNVIVSSNATGKSQLVGAIIAALIGRPAVRIDRDGVGPSLIDVVAKEGDVEERLGMCVSMGSMGDVSIRQRAGGAEAEPSLGVLGGRLLAACSDHNGPRLLVTRRALQAQSWGLSPGELEAILPDTLKGSHEWPQLRACLGSKGARAGVGRESAGRMAVGGLLLELARRANSHASLPLILDEYVDNISEAHVTLCTKVLEAIAEVSQVIVLTYTPTASGAENVIQLWPRASEVRSLVYYNRLLEEQRPRFKRRARFKWVRGEIFPLQESRTCELKETKGSNPVAAIGSLVDQYVVAFLNARKPKEGMILWGIRDSDRKVVGVGLSDQDCDELRRLATDKLQQISPPLAPTAYRIELHRVSDGAMFIPNLYVIEVRVPSARRSLLFSTGSREVYVKTDAGKRRLSALEIQYELLDRLGIDVPF